LTDNEYTKRLDFFIGPVLQFASTSIYKQEIEDDADIEEGLIELRKDFIYEQGYKLKGFVIYGIQSKAE